MAISLRVDDPLRVRVLYASDLVGNATRDLERQLAELFGQHPRAHSVKLAQTMTIELVGNDLVETIVVTVVYREPEAS